MGPKSCQVATTKLLFLPPRDLPVCCRYSPVFHWFGRMHLKSLEKTAASGGIQCAAQRLMQRSRRFGVLCDCEKNETATRKAKE